MKIIKTMTTITVKNPPPPKTNQYQCVIAFWDCNVKISV